MVFVIHWHESAMGLQVFSILIPPPTSLSNKTNNSVAFSTFTVLHKRYLYIVLEYFHHTIVKPFREIPGSPGVRAPYFHSALPIFGWETKICKPHGMPHPWKKSRSKGLYSVSSFSLFPARFISQYPSHCSLSLCICIFQTFHVNTTEPYNMWPLGSGFSHLNNVVEVHSFCGKYWFFIPFCGWIIFHCTYIQQLVYSSVNEHLGYFHLLDIWIRQLECACTCTCSNTCFLLLWGIYLSMTFQVIW